MKDTFTALVVPVAMFISKKCEALCDMSYPSNITLEDATRKSSPRENAANDFRTEEVLAFTNHCDAPVTPLVPANWTQ